MKTALFTLVASFCGVTASAIQPGMIDLSFNSGGEGTFEEVHSLAVQPDGKILIGGDFTEFNGVSRNRLARLLANGKLDPAFEQFGTGANATVHAMAVLTNQHTLIAGAFTNYGGLNCGRMARIDEFGLPDSAFSGVGADGTVHALMVLPSGQVLVAGAFTSFDGQTRRRIARVTADGVVDALFFSENGADGTVRALAVQADGKILIGGDFAQYGISARRGIARLKEDGTLDTEFNPGTGVNGNVNAISVLPDGKILVAGAFTDYNGTLRQGLVRLNEDGTLDPEFHLAPGWGILGEIRALAVQPDGRIVIGGDFTLGDAGGVNEIGRITRLFEDGNLDPSFKVNGAETVRVLVLRPEGKAFVGGVIGAFNPTWTSGVVRIHLGYIHSSTRFTGMTEGSLYGTQEGSADANPLLGRVSVRLSKSGAVSGKLATGVETLRFAGMFDETGRIIVASKRKNGDAVLFDLRLIRDFDGGEWVNGWVGDYLGRRVYLQAKAPFFSARKQPARSYDGRYLGSLLSDPPASVGSLPVSGAGFLRCTVDLAGRARLTGKAADGSVLMASVDLSANGMLLLHFPLYRGQGFLNGRLFILDNRPNEPQTFYGGMRWSRPVSSAYPLGFDQNVMLRGRFYRPQLGSLPPFGGLVESGLRFTVSGGHISGAPEVWFHFNRSGRGVISQGSEIGMSSLRIQVSRSTGFFFGSFLHPVSRRRISFQGVLNDPVQSHGFALVRGVEDTTLPGTVMVEDFYP
jgi:uncharacterized delta-60 repeat protein